MTQLVVLDPGLRETGGHHPAFILALLGTELFKANDARLRVFANTGFAPGAVFDSGTNNVEYTPFFESDFYRYFYESTQHPELPNFIRRLTKEYLAAMKQVTETYCQPKAVKGRASVFLCHALGWAHATALADALFLFKKQTGITLRIVVMLMFSPYRKTVNEQYDSQVYLRYRMAFKGLAACDGVSFFACDHETSKAYGNILARQIDVMPCSFVGGSKKINSRVNSRANKVKQIVLYIGDSKATKGFLALPNLLEEIVKPEQAKCLNYIIQYTLTNKSEAFLAVDKKLKTLAELHPNVAVFDTFWSEKQLHTTLAAADALVFNYDSSVYMYQSSGVLWLAAYFNVNMFFLSRNWLTREAARLQSEYTLCESKKLAECLNKLSQEKIDNKAYYAKILPLGGADYHAKLFGDFTEWLNCILGHN
ncbi:hypothetical protein N9865_00640 [Paraglaciecola sp.]|nr:hypothetical protein [Paraglaciecola sp.]